MGWDKQQHFSSSFVIYHIIAIIYAVVVVSFVSTPWYRDG
jgi:hypothetical protein